MTGYAATYSKENKSETITEENYTVSPTYATSFEENAKYILKTNKGIALKYDGTSHDVNNSNQITEDVLFTATATGSSSELRNKNNKSLNITYFGIYFNGNNKISINNNGILLSRGYRDDHYLAYNNGKFTNSSSSPLEDNSVKAYKVEKNIINTTINKEVRTVHNTKVATGSFGAGDTTLNGKEIPHSKSIDYLGDSTENKDSKYSLSDDLADKYRLYLDAGPIADENPIELILVLDKSASMDDKLNSEKKWNQLKDSLTGTNGVLPDFFKLNKDNRVRIITFGTSAEIDTGIYGSVNEVNNSPSFTNALYDGQNGGTNYEDALVKLSGVLDNPLRGYSQYVIFLSDGVPTCHNENGIGVVGGGQNTDDTDATHTANAIKELYRNHSVNNKATFTLSTIYFGSGNPSVFLGKNAVTTNYDDVNNEGQKVKIDPPLPSSDGFAVSANNKTSLQEALYLMALGPRCRNLSISDTLSQWVEFDEKAEVLVKAIPIENNNLDYEHAITIYHSANLTEKESNGSLKNEAKNFSFPNKDTTGLHSTVENWTNTQVFGDQGGVFIDGKKITLKFNDSWFMDANYRYEISFNVVVPQTTYSEYAINGYPDSSVGSLKSDYLPMGNKTSVNQPGFFSNATSSLEYTYVNPYNSSETKTLSTSGTSDETKLQPYQEPVVQADARILSLSKYSDDGTTPLGEATFTLYTATSEGLGEVIQGTNIHVLPTNIVKNTNESGIIDFGTLANGQTYYIEETTPPNGYLYPDYALIKVVFDGTNIKVSLIDKNGNDLTGDKYEIGNPKCPVSMVPNGSRITLKVNNTPGQELPNTGGAGTKLFTFSGAAVIAASGLMYGYKKKKDKRNGKGGLRK